MITKTKLRFAVQKSGRLREESLSFLKNLGLDFVDSADEMLVENNELQILFLRDDDIPNCVASGLIDFGIAGKNVVCEQGLEKLILKELDFAFCNLMIAVKEEDEFSALQDLAGLRIATSYPKILNTYLEQQGVRASLIKLSGAVEIAPRLNLADAVCDLVQSGATLKKNGLKPIWEVFASQAVLLGRAENLNKLL